MLSSAPAGQGGPAPSSKMPTSRSPQVRRLWWFRGSRFWILPIVMLGLSSLLAVLMAGSSSEDATTISGLGLFASLFLALLSSFWLSFRAISRRERWAWRVIALAELSYLVAALIVIGLFSTSEQVVPTTSVADGFFLPFYPLIAFGAILFPTIESTAAKQMRVLVDVCIGVGAFVGLGLVFLIAPRLASGSGVDLVFVGYPVADLTVLLVLVVLLARGVPRAYRPALFWLTVGMFCFIYADSAFNYLTLPGLSGGPEYKAGNPLVDTFWIIGAFALSLAPLTLLVEGEEPGTAWSWIERLMPRLRVFRLSRLSGQFFLLAAPVLVLFGLILFLSTQPERAGAALALDLLTLLVILLIIVRQLLTMRDLVDARIATERAQQLDELKDQFITSVNHELRTPLMTMQGYLELLSDQEARVTPEKRWDMLERARGACGSLVHLVRSILDTRRIEQEAGDFIPEIVSVREAAQAALSLMDPREANPAGRHLRLHIPENLIIWGDPVRVQQILTNLLSNAIKYSPPEAPIMVMARVVTERGAHLLGWGATNRASRQMVEIMVQDKGLGIPPEQKDLLFRRFVRLPREIASNIHGNGLGLYLCRVFAEAMGGTIWVESSGVPGEGSSFYLRLPTPVGQSLQTLAPPLAASARE